MTLTIYLVPRRSPLSARGETLVFDYLAVDIDGGNPAQLIAWNGKHYTLVGWDSDKMEVTYKEQP